ncbi:cell wall metabolism sensor histidine kinase WalK [Kroppenstedtia pulmonis]|uniref:histidine kinase n=1 Tax=Kroppenstedtia pulmonis TaxID=1380685 RepID=A0A7D4B3L6_9BACL|nr:ATP-binding protein [Kroppenstedtia pulmonis]QKG85446.1 cell wall metabolism sensor histidine kinase WalK [Kroppenstedtia pulmonis]
MKSHGIQYQISFYFGILIILIVIVLETLFIFSIRQYYYGNAEDDLIRQATVSASFYNLYAPSGSLKEKGRYILENGMVDPRHTFEIIDWEYRVLLNAEGLSPGHQVMTSDVSMAMTDQIGVWTGTSEQTKERILAVSTPLKTGDRIVGILRFSTSIEALDRTVLNITWIALLVGITVILLFLVISSVLSKRIVKPIEELTRVAKTMAEGNFDTKASKYYNDEVGTLADTLNYLSDEIVKADKMKNDFISSVSHELRTPLTSIKGWGDTLLTGDLDDREETKAGLSVISRETERLTRLVEDLLDFSKLQSGRFSLQLNRLDLNPLVHEIKDQFSFRKSGKSVDIEAHTTSLPLEVLGDRYRLQQVLVNLVDNAIKFSPPGGIIRIKTEQRGGRAVVIVSDEGPGIPPAELKQVKEKFYKGRTNRSGSGLGLAISEEMIQLHHGRLEIHSLLGQGTRVLIRLPLLPARTYDH